MSWYMYMDEYFSWSKKGIWSWNYRELWTTQPGCWEQDVLLTHEAHLKPQWFSSVVLYIKEETSLFLFHFILYLAGGREQYGLKRIAKVLNLNSSEKDDHMP